MRKLILTILLCWVSQLSAAPVNVWLALRDDGQTAIVTRLQCDRASDCTYVTGVSQAQCDTIHQAFLDAQRQDDCNTRGPVTNRQAKVFALMSDRGNVQRLFRADTVAGREWTLWSVYFDEPGGVLLLIQAELDNLAAKYPAQFAIAGAWHWDGRQVGTQWVDVMDHSQGTTGAPTYARHSRLIQFMPDIVTYNANGAEISRTRPLTLSDVNLSLGQSPRKFQ